MTNQILMETAERDLKGLLAQLSLGDTVTLADETGRPLALLVSLKAKPNGSAVNSGEAASDWIEQMKALAKRVDAAWQGDKSGLEELAEMRR